MRGLDFCHGVKLNDSPRNAREKLQSRGTGGLLALDAVAVLAITTSSRTPNETYPNLALALFGMALPILVAGYLYQEPGLRGSARGGLTPWVDAVLFQAPLFGLALMAVAFAALLLATSPLALVAFVISLIIAVAIYVAGSP